MRSRHLPFVPKGVVFRDDQDKVEVESRNGILQTNFLIATIQDWTAASTVTPALLKQFQYLAVTQVYRCAGFFRDGEVELKSSLTGVSFHQPPPPEQVEGLVAEMCDYVNHGWATMTAVHLAAYVMWRLNWIHPFFGGNGRTSRAFSYLVLSARLGFTLPGRKAIPELIVENRTPYYSALRKADETLLQTGRFDLTAMEALMSSLLAAQLVQVHNSATGKTEAI